MRVVEHNYITYHFGIIINNYWHVDGDINYIEYKAYMFYMQYGNYVDLYVSTSNGCPVMMYFSNGLLIGSNYIKSTEYI